MCANFEHVNFHKCVQKRAKCVCGGGGGGRAKRSEERVQREIERLAQCV